MSSPEPEEERGANNKLLIFALVGAIVAAGLFCGLWLIARSTSPAEVDEALSAEAPEARDVAREVIELLINLDAENVDGAERSVGFTLRLTLVKDGGGWKADAFELLGEL